MPKISVIIPTANRQELLERAISSVIAQTYKDIEIIVVDDGDKVDAHAAVLKLNDGRIRYISHEPRRQGGGAARNTGIHSAKASIIAFLDDDDQWLPEKLVQQMEVFEHSPHDVGFCYTRVRNQGATSSTENPVQNGVNDLHELALTQFKGFITSSLMVKRSVFDFVGAFDASFPSHQEIELILRITEHYKGIGIDRVLVLMDGTDREHIGGDIRKRIAGREMLLAKHARMYVGHPDKLAKVNFTLGLWYRDLGEYRRSASIFFHCFKLAKDIRYLFHSVHSLFRSFIVKM